MSFTPPDPRKSFYIFVTGMKGRGKSVYCRAWWDGYPFDRMVIDPTHDVRNDLRRDGVDFVDLGTGPDLPRRFPSGRDGAPVTAVFCPDMGSPTAMDDIDRACGLALRGPDQPMMLWIDEAGAATTGARTPPNQRRILHHGRHHALSLLEAGPRAMDIDPLVIGQADAVVMFRCPVVYDNDRLADSIGWPRQDLADLNREWCQGHAHLFYDRPDEQMYKCPPLPARRAGRNSYQPTPDQPVYRSNDPKEPAL